jgi:hypothetical protein
MKKLLFTVSLVLSLMNGYSQETTVVRKLAADFVNYYNADQADSLSALFSDEVKKQMPAANVPPVINQLKSQLGKLLNSEFFAANNGITSYVCTFEKSGPVLYLHFDKSNKLAGFYVNEDKRKKTLTETINITDHSK